MKFRFLPPNFRYYMSYYIILYWVIVTDMILHNVIMTRYEPAPRFANTMLRVLGRRLHEDFLLFGISVSV